jgi:hypothetical protein
MFLVIDVEQKFEVAEHEVKLAVQKLMDENHGS